MNDAHDNAIADRDILDVLQDEGRLVIIPVGRPAEGPYRVDVMDSAGVRRGDTWTSNRLTFDTPERAKAYASDLYGRWMGMDKFRVVPASHPENEAYVAGSEDSW